MKKMLKTLLGVSVLIILLTFGTSCGKDSTPSPQPIPTPTTYSVSASASESTVYPGDPVIISFAASSGVTDVKVNGVSQGKTSGSTTIPVTAKSTIPVVALKGAEIVYSTSVSVDLYSPEATTLCKNGMWYQYKEEADTLLNGTFFPLGTLNPCLLGAKTSFDMKTGRATTYNPSGCGAAQQVSVFAFHGTTTLEWANSSPENYFKIHTLNDTEMILIRRGKYLNLVTGVVKDADAKTYYKHP